MWRRRNRVEDSSRHDAEAAATGLLRHLQCGGDLASITVADADLPLADGELAVADVACETARFYGTEVVYPRTRAGYYESHPVFGRRWVPNPRLDARRHREAEAAAEPRWRDHAPARVVLTSTGLRLKPFNSGAWLPFDHALLTEVTVGPEVQLCYSVCAPLRLAGPPAAWLGVAIEHLRRTAE